MGKLRGVSDYLNGIPYFSAEYDGGGERTSSNESSGSHVYSRGLHDTAGDTTYTPGLSQRQSGADRYFHSDWRGSTRSLTSPLGAATSEFRYDGYGRTSAQSGPDSKPYRFAGGFGYESDGPLGFQLLGHRYYDPFSGSFLSPDPIGFAGGPNPAGAVLAIYREDTTLPARWRRRRRRRGR